MVPVLVEDGLVLWESHTILRYLAAKYGPPSLYPADLRDRALVDQWLDWKIAHVSPAIRPLFFTHFLKTGDFSDREVADAEAECARLFTILDAQLAKTGAYATGPELTIADCALGMAEAGPRTHSSVLPAAFAATLVSKDNSDRHALALCRSQVSFMERAGLG
jgi:glutathione S-transferase